MNLEHRRDEKKKATQYIVTLDDSELEHYKEMMSGPLDQDVQISKLLTDVVSDMIVRRILTDLKK